MIFLIQYYDFFRIFLFQGQNKLLLMIPCHRVVCSNGSMGGYSGKGGIKLNKKLLEFERS